jgi:hypothetical protein
MKAIVQVSDLLEHRRVFTAARPNRKVARSTSVTLTVSESLTVTGMGLSVEVECEALEWGRVVVPYTIWSAFLHLLGTIDQGRVEIAAEDGQIALHRSRLRHPGIKATPLENVSFQIPIDASEPEIIRKLFEIGIDRVRDSGNWNLVRKTMINLSKRIDTAVNQLSPYGVNPRNMARLVGYSLGVKDIDSFVDVLTAVKEDD